MKNQRKTATATAAVASSSLLPGKRRRRRNRWRKTKHNWPIGMKWISMKVVNEVKTKKKLQRTNEEQQHQQQNYVMGWDGMWGDVHCAIIPLWHVNDVDTSFRFCLDAKGEKKNRRNNTQREDKSILWFSSILLQLQLPKHSIF